MVKFLLMSFVSILTVVVFFFEDAKEIIKLMNDKTPPVYLQIQGGLGNQMFEYAYGYTYAKKHNKKLVLASRHDLHKFFNIPEDYQDAKKYLNIIEFFKGAYDEKLSKETPDEVMDKGEKLFLKGYFQNEEFFASEKDEILKLFTYQGKLSQENQKLVDEMALKNSISVHFRLGDYLVAFKDDILSNHYYLSAMSYMKQKFPDAYFYIFSDDTDFVKKNIKIPFEHTIVENNKNDDSFFDMYLMSQCKHNIIANSTFSWWGGWLNKNVDKKIIAPSVWLSRKEDYKIIKNVVPKDWLKMPSKAKIAVVFLMENSEDVFEQYFLPFDKKTYFTLNNQDEIFPLIESEKLSNYDYVFVIRDKLNLKTDVYYDIVPFNTDELMFIRFDNQGVLKTEKTNANIISVKGKNVKKILDLYE